MFRKAAPGLALIVAMMVGFSLLGVFLAARGDNPDPTLAPPKPTPTAAAPDFHPQADPIAGDPQAAVEAALPRVSALVARAYAGDITPEELNTFLDAMVPAYPMATSCIIRMGWSAVRAKDLKAAIGSMDLWEASAFPDGADAVAHTVKRTKPVPGGTKPGPDGPRGQWVPVKGATRIVVAIGADCR